MAIEDYIPNVFGNVPETYQGLLGADETANLQKRANIQGLLGAAAALSQGMSPQGYRRSALQNILGAVAGGFGAANQAMSGGLQDFATRQQIQKGMLDLSRQAQTVKAVEQVIQSPEVANNPTLVAYFRANPEKALERQVNIQMAREARGGIQQPQQPQQPVAEAFPVPAPGESNMPAVEVTARQSPYQKNIVEAENAANFYAAMGTKEGADLSAKFRDEANYYRGLQRQDELSGGITAALANVDPTLRRRADAIIANAPSLTQEQLQSRMDAILSDDAKLKEQLDPRFAEQRLKERRAGATIVDMGTREMDKEFAKVVVEDTRASFQAAKSSVKTINTINDLRNVLSKGVYEGTLGGAPRAIDQIATALKISGKDTQEKLANTARVMQGLASLELTAAEAMKGQGAITENERTLIARAAGGNLQQFTSVEVQALLDALDKVARSKIESHQMNYEVMSKDPIGRKYSKYYKLDVPPPYTSPAPSGVTVRRVR